MAHSLILGTTESGKTTLAKKICANLTRAGWGTLVLDPICDPEWNASAVFGPSDLEEFMETAKASRRCFLFCDEAGMNFSQGDKEAWWLATRGRHWGHSCFFLSQRAIGQGGVAKTIRDQCSRLFLFSIGLSDAKLLADEYNKPALVDASGLAQFEYLYCGRFSDVKRCKVKL